MDFIPARHQGGLQKPRAIVMHGTVSADTPGTARKIAQWWAGSTSPVTSAHYTVDPGEVIQSIKDDRVAYHCGYNYGSLGVELCDEQTGPAARWQDKNSQAIIARAARLVAAKCVQYGIEPRRPTVAELKAKGPHGIYGHDDSRRAFGNTTHTDPKDFPWGQFLALVRAEIEGGDDMASAKDDIIAAVRASQKAVGLAIRENRAQNETLAQQNEALRKQLAEARRAIGLLVRAVGADLDANDRKIIERLTADE